MEKAKQFDKKICRYLRAKNAYGGTMGGHNPWYDLGDANTIYWCIKSVGGSAPDNGIVDMKLCVSGRRCFTEPNS